MIRVRNGWLMLVLLFVISILFRFDIMKNQPRYRGCWSEDYSLWTNTEVCAHNQLIYANFDTNPARVHKWLLAVPNSPDFMINPQNKNLNVYTSFPATAFLVPYFTAKALQLEPGFTFMQCFNLALQLATTLLLYFTVLAAFKKDREEVSAAGVLTAVLSSAVYLFGANILHNHSNVYWAHCFFQPFMALTLLLLVKYRNQINLFVLFALCYLLPAIVWGGYVANAGIGLFLFLDKLSELDKFSLQGLWRVLRQLALKAAVVTLATAAALATYIIHHLLVMDFSSLYHYHSQRFYARAAGSVSYERYMELFSQVMQLEYGSLTLLAAVLLVTGIVVCKLRKQKIINSAGDRLLLILTTVTLFCILESVLLVEHDFVYGFSRLKFALPVIFLTAFALKKLFEQKREAYKVLLPVFGLCFAANVLVYRGINSSCYQSYNPIAYEKLWDKDGTFNKAKIHYSYEADSE